MGYSLAITEYQPTANAVNISRDTSIRISFNRDLKIETLLAAERNFRVDKRSGESVPYTYTDVAGEITYADKQAVFTPAADLDPDSVYRVTVVGDNPDTVSMDGVQDIFGDGMLGSLVYVFTTNSTEVLVKPTMTDPLINTTYDELPDITWQAVAGATSYEVEISAASDFSAAVWDTIVTNGDTTVTPNVAVIDGSYYVRLRYSIDGVYSLWSDTIRIYVDSDIEDTMEIEDYLEIVSISPTASYNLATNTAWTITFDDSITSSLVKLIDYPLVETIITPVVTDKVMTITPSGLAGNKQYSLYIEASSTDEAVTKELAEPLEITFTTVYDPMFVTYSDVAMEIGSLVNRVSAGAVYNGIRDASLYVKQIRLAVEAANPLLTPIDWDDISGLPLYITQYVKYAGAANSLTNLLIEKSDHSGELRTLGDFTIQDYTGAETGLEKILGMLNDRARVWLDQVYELGMSRGYAMPQSAVRGLSSSPYQSYHTRTIRTS